MRAAAAVIAAGAAFAFASPAMAAGVAVRTAAHSGDTLVDKAAGEFSSGGEFKVISYSGGYLAPYSGVLSSVGDENSLFNTFCLERNDGIGSIACTTLGNVAMGGGINTSSGDTLGADTAQLFYSFWTNKWVGSLASTGYDYSDSAGRTADAKAMQVAIWFLENELDVQFADVTALASFNQRAADFVNYATSVSWTDLNKGSWDSINGGLGHVRVMVNTEADGAHRQDTLVIVPLPPAALSGLALLAGLGLVGSVRRRRRS
jgi:hypothetical protein